MLLIMNEYNKIRDYSEIVKEILTKKNKTWNYIFKKHPYLILEKTIDMLSIETEKYNTKKSQLLKKEKQLIKKMNIQLPD